MPFPDTDKDATKQAMNDPQVGDHFTEMYSFHVYVVHRQGDWVATMEGSPPCEFPNTNTKLQTVDEFRKRFHYGTIDDYSVRLVGRGENVDGWLTAEKVGEV